jgi:hypothetical protein
LGSEGLADSGVQTLTLPLRGPLPLPWRTGEGVQDDQDDTEEDLALARARMKEVESG